MTQVAAGAVTGMTNVTYGRKEKEPTTFTLQEFFSLRNAMPAESRALMDRELEDLKGKKF